MRDAATAKPRTFSGEKHVHPKYGTGRICLLVRARIIQIRYRRTRPVRWKSFRLCILKNTDVSCHKQTVRQTGNPGDSDPVIDDAIHVLNKAMSSPVIKGAIWCATII